MKRYTLFITGSLVIVSLLSASFLWFASASHATPRSSAARHRQMVVFPTRSQWAAKHARSSTNPGAYGSGDLQYHGGNAETTPQLYVVFWGSGWSSASPDVQIVENYFTDVSGTSFENILTQYYGFYGITIANTLNFSGTWMDAATPPTDSSCGGATIQDSSIQNEVSKAISTNGWPKSAIYFIYTPNGYYINDGFNDCSDQNTLTGFCGYHSYISSQAISYAAIPYPFDLQGCGVPTSPNNDVYGDSLVNISSHEQFESISDPDVNTGWYDATGLEIGDKCAFDFSSGLTSLNSGTFEVQTEYSNVSSSCVNTFTAGAFIRSDVPAVYAVTTPGQTGWSQPVNFTNSGSLPLNWSANSLPSWVTVTPTSGSIGPHSSQQISLSLNAPNGTTQTYTTHLVLSAANTINAPFSIPITLVLANVSRQWYFGEGYTGGGFTTYLTLANASQAFANVQVKYLLGSGAPVIKNYQVNPGARYTINVNNEIGPNQNVSMVITADEPIVAERPMYFTFASSTWKISLPGGSDVLGATSLGTDFDFGYLDTTSNHDTYLTILNQDPTTAMDVAISYYAAAGGIPTVIHHSVPANSRGTVHVNDEGLPLGTYSALVHLSLPGLVERPMYLRDGITGNTGAADVVGVTQPLPDWYFAEGFIDPTFSERYIVANPSTTTTAHVTITFFLASGAPQTTSFTLVPGQQAILNASSVPNVTSNNSAHVTANQPILAERFMSFKFSPTIPGATDVLGAAAPSNLFYFAEGFTGSGFSEYLTIENPDPSQTANVTVNYLSSSGGPPKTQIYVVPPSSRFTLNTVTVMPNQSFSMVVESNVPIVAERPMYFFFAPGKTGGSDVVGYQPPGAALPPTGLGLYLSSDPNQVYVTALDARSGAVRWSEQSSGIGVYTSAVAVANGIAYFTANAVTAVHTSDGSLLWSTQIAGPLSAPTVAGGVVYVATSRNLAGYIYALDANTGAVLWQRQVINPTTGSSSIISTPLVVDNGSIYFGSNGHALYAVSASDGSPLWNYLTSNNVNSTPAIANGIVYFGSDDTDLYAVSASNGSLLWSYQTGGAVDSNPVVVSGIVYVQSNDSHLYALNASNGLLLWRYAVSSLLGSSPAVDNGMVFTGSGNTMVALDAATGNHLWTYQLPSTITGSVTVVAAGNGAVYFGDNVPGGFVYALQESDGSLLWGVQTQIDTSITIAP